MSLGQRIKNLRDELDLTQEDLGKVLNVSKPTISRYEADTNEPNTDTLKKLAEYFNVSLDYLMGLTNIRNPYKNENIETVSERLEQYKTLKDDLIELMIRQGIIKDKSSVNEKHLEFIEYAIETYKNEQNNG